MPNYSVKIDVNAIRAKVMVAAGKVGQPIATKKAFTLFKRAKDTLLKEFYEHNVTQEILAGPRAVNISGTLDGYGNLFSFIGFHEGDTPIERLELLFENFITFRPTVYRNGTFYFRVSTPDKRSIESFTDMPWEHGTSWAEGIEKGISNLSYYINKKKRNPKSFSGYGFQLGHEVNSDLVFKNTPYLTPILKNFRETINGGI